MRGIEWDEVRSTETKKMEIVLPSSHACLRVLTTEGFRIAKDGVPRYAAPKASLTCGGER